MDKSCEVCARSEQDRPMVFRGEPWCSDRCRKVYLGEEKPTDKEWASMRPRLFEALGGVCRR